MLDASGKPTPPRARASVLREELLGRLPPLEDLERSLKRSAGSRALVSADAVAIARRHLQAAIDALELAGLE